MNETPRSTLDIPTDVFRATVLSLLPIDSISRLDSACCNKQLRSKLHAAVREHIIFNRTEIFLTPAVEAWSLSRGCYFDKYRIAFAVQEDHLRDLLQQSTSVNIDLDPYEVQDTTAALRAVLESAPRLKHLEVCAFFEESTQSEDALLLQYPAGLRYVIMDDDKFSDQRVHSIVSQCRHLESLQIHNSNLLTGASLRSVAQHCGALQELSLSGDEYNSVRAEDVAVLAASCPALRSLTLASAAAITDSAIISLAARCTSLQLIKLSRAERVTGASLRSLADSCANLTSIDLGDCQHVSDEAVVYLAARCVKLQVVKLGGGVLLTGTAVEALAAHCREITSFDLSRCVGVPSSAVQALGRGCPPLKYVVLRQCALVDDAAIVALVHGCANLARIDLTRCNLITDAAVIALAMHSRRLSSLLLSFCELVGDAAMQALALHCKEELMFLYITGCPLITAEARQTLREAIFDLRIF